MHLRTLLCASVLLTPAPALAQRLPQTVQPIHYDLIVAPDLQQATFTGTETIRVRVEQETPAIVLNAAEIALQEVTITDAAGRAQKADTALNPRDEQATFRVATPLARGEAVIRIQYTGILNKDLRGLYLSEANGRRYAVTQLEATDARRMFPSFDEPAFKATFALTAIIDDGDTAISNGAVLSDTPGPSAGKHTITFATTAKMSSYLVALAVGDFVCTAGKADAVPVRICSTPDKKHLTAFALQSASEALRYLNRYYSMPYPFGKLDIVAVPDFAAGAMENTAAIFYREEVLLADANATPAKQKEIAVVLAHEIAHQWFGDLVTMAWWDDLWLNEGFANWMMTKPIREWKPEWNVELDEVLDNHKAMGVDALRSTRPIRSRATTPAEINEQFDAIAYEKGAAVLRMLESWLGEADFRAGVNAYLERFKYRNARAEDFWATLASVTGKPVDRVMPTFVSQPGVPLVKLEIACGENGGANRLLLSQARYLSDTAANDGKASQLWQIPVCVRASTGETECKLLDKPRDTMPLHACPAWVMPNAGARGYYRTATAPEAVRNVAKNVSTLTPAERLALLADEWALVRAGHHDVGSYLDLAAGFAGERDARVMQTLTEGLAGIDDDLATTATQPQFRAWVARLLAPAFADVGMTGRSSEDVDRRALRANVLTALADTADVPDVRSKALELVAQELARPGTLEPTLRNAVVRVAPLAGDARLYDQYLARAKSVADPEERYLYLHALTVFTDPALVRRTFDLIVGPEIRTQDVSPMLAAVFGRPENRALAWKLFRERWEDVQRKTSETFGFTLVVGSLGAFCDARAHEEIQAFFAGKPLPQADRTLQQALERIDSCARWATAQAPKLAAWLPSEH